MKHFARPAFAALAALSLSAALAQAQSIAIQNYDFNTPTLANGAYTAYPAPGTAIPGWTTGPILEAGIQNFNGTGDYTAMPSGPQAAFDDGQGGGPGSFYQDLTGSGSLDLLSAGTYTLTAYGGWRNDKSWVGGSISLYTTTGDLLGTQALAQPTQGYFALTTLTVNIAPTNADIGDQLRVQLTSNGNSTGFDDIALNFEAAPEPSTWALMLGTLALLGFLIRPRSPARA